MVGSRDRPRSAGWFAIEDGIHGLFCQSLLALRICSRGAVQAVARSMGNIRVAPGSRERISFCLMNSAACLGGSDAVGMRLENTSLAGFAGKTIS
jgi:hypothetical protein